MPGRLLGDAQGELSHDGQQVVEHIGLGSFKVNEAGIDREAVNFQRQAIRIGSQLPDGEQQVVADTRVCAQIILYVSPERTEVGEAAGVNGVVLGTLVFRVPVSDVCQLGVDV